MPAADRLKASSGRRADRSTQRGFYKHISIVSRPLPSWHSGRRNGRVGHRRCLWLECARVSHEAADAVMLKADFRSSAGYVGKAPIADDQLGAC